ncbi:unnamed protein product [Mytilus edulis]|uniref:Novel STAND NTPase 3 domain-containing protein n=1 Tax=Mytilus edulis TaxID=6550 RepID=A0A8S3V7Q6_MYTED|nr:unnamed protein product [Mytilus edulis]
MHLEYIKRGAVQDRFIHTKAFTCIYDTVSENKVTVISGPPGCGKTVLSYQTALKLKETENYVIVVITNPWQLMAFLNSNTKQVFVIDDIVGKYSLNDNSLQSWEANANFIIHFLGRLLNTKLIVTCRSYIYRNKKFNSLKLPHIHCDMLADNMLMTMEERQQICSCHMSEEEAQSLQDSILMLYNFFH